MGFQTSSDCEDEMSSFEKKYQLAFDAPGAIGFEEYAKSAKAEWDSLIGSGQEPESAFQDFLERNPCMLPIAGNVNHRVVHGCCISQPRITSSQLNRVPDFMWIASTSLELIPVLIEIEKPSKNAFRLSDGVQSAQFSQAENQINEWKVLLDNGREEFYERYSIPSGFKRLKFSPKYVLVYGRRSEYEGQELLIKKRANKNQQDVEILSFDRLTPNYNLRHCPTAKLDASGLKLLHVPPTFELGPMMADDLVGWLDFEVAVDRSRSIDQPRKTFLKERAKYWRSYATSEREKGVICASDWE